MAPNKRLTFLVSLTFESIISKVLKRGQVDFISLLHKEVDYNTFLIINGDYNFFIKTCKILLYGGTLTE